MDRYTIT